VINSLSRRRLLHGVRKEVTIRSLSLSLEYPCFYHVHKEEDIRNELRGLQKQRCEHYEVHRPAMVVAYLALVNS
jgi:hypothetical protein